MIETKVFFKKFNDKNGHRAGFSVHATHCTHVSSTLEGEIGEREGHFGEGLNCI